jgi:hypothetical protein
MGIIGAGSPEASRGVIGVTATELHHDIGKMI